jgi:hypothetical protein
MEKTIYDLGLHEDTTTNFGICIMRVPGGWIYDSWDKDRDRFNSGKGIFIPFDNEFQGKELPTPETYNTPAPVINPDDDLPF